VDSKQASQMTTGLVVVAIGLMLLAGQFDSTWGFDFGRLWPLIFIFLGLGRLASPERGSAVWFLFLGGIFLLHTFRVVSLRDSWPLFIVAAGVSMMFRQDGRGRRTRAGSSGPGSAGAQAGLPGQSDGRLHP